jgi:hypothetical protein
MGAESLTKGIRTCTPSIAVTEDGDVRFTYDELRTLQPGNTTKVPTSTWLTVSPRGGQKFDDERRIAPVFDLLQAPNAGGLAVPRRLPGIDGVRRPGPGDDRHHQQRPAEQPQ